MTAQEMSQNLPKRSLRDFLSLRHPNHFVLAGANNRNVIITYRFLAVPVQANRDFFWHTDCIFQLLVLSLIYARVTSKSASSGEIPAEAIKARERIDKHVAVMVA